MRFHISFMNRDTGESYLVEAIGDTVDIPGMPPESCAVHALVNAGADAPLYAVSHIESGWRVAGGDSIDFAIQRAREIVARVDAEKRNATLEMAVKMRRKIERTQAAKRVKGA
ncbi:hypothetical protein [Cupriavidus taiwanensis]|uniref:hypothetical protein n=1 Tax=Cupriavidus taiwanensis TaxID=164546 RepID=UPI000E2FC47F|nr:hypothetical protein [Cupriavidus taiwanensis]